MFGRLVLTSLFLLSSFLAAGDTTCCIWDPTELAERDLLCGHVSHGKKEVEAVAFTPDGTVLATGGRDNDIALSFLSVPGTVNTL